MADTGVVTIGSLVEIRDGAVTERWRIVDPAEADAAQRLISSESPLARALMGRQAGERVRVRAPEGRPVLILEVGR